MATPFKMKGHTLPGPNQKKSPMKEPFSTTGLIVSGVLTAAAAAKQAADAKRKKTEAKKAKASAEGQAATESQQAGISGEMGGSSKITD